MMRRKCLTGLRAAPQNVSTMSRLFTTKNNTDEHPTTPSSTPHSAFISSSSSYSGGGRAPTILEDHDGEVQAPMMPTSSRRLPSQRALSYAAGVAVRGGRGGHIRGASRLSASTPSHSSSNGSNNYQHNRREGEDALTAALTGFLRAQSETLMRRCLKVILFELGRTRYSVHRVPAMGEASTNGDLWIRVIQRAAYFHVRGMTFQLDGGGGGSSGEQQIGMVEVVLMLYRHLGEIRAQIAVPSSFGRSLSSSSERGGSNNGVPMGFLDDPVFTGKLVSTVVTVLAVQPPSENRDPSNPWRFLLDNLLAIFPGVSPVAVQQAVLFPDERLPATVVHWFLQLVESPTGTVTVLPTDEKSRSAAPSSGGGAPVDPHLAKIQEALQRDALRQKVSEHGALASISEWLKSRRRGGGQASATDTPLPDLTSTSTTTASNDKDTQQPQEGFTTPTRSHSQNSQKRLFKLKPEECMVVLDQLVGVIAALSHQYRENSWIRQLLLTEEGSIHHHEQFNSSSRSSSGRLAPVAPQVAGAGASSPLFVVLETAMASRLRSPSRYLQCDPLCGEALLQAYFLPAAAVLASHDRFGNNHHAADSDHHHLSAAATSNNNNGTSHDDDDLRGVHLARLSFILYRYTGLLSRDDTSSTSTSTSSSSLTAEVERSPLVEVLLCAAIKTAFQDSLSLGGSYYHQSHADLMDNIGDEIKLQKKHKTSNESAADDDIESTVQMLAGRLTKQHSALALYEELRMAVATDVRVAMVKTILKGIQEQWGLLRRVVEQHPSVVVLTSRHIVPPEDIPTSSNHNNNTSSSSSSSPPSTTSVAARCDRFIEDVFTRVIAAVVEGLLYEGLRPLWRAAGNFNKTPSHQSSSSISEHGGGSNLPPTLSSVSQLSDLLCSAAALFGSIRPVDGLPQYLSSTAVNNNRVDPQVARICGDVCALQQYNTTTTPTNTSHGRHQHHQEPEGLVLFHTNYPDVVLDGLLVRLFKRGQALSSSSQPLHSTFPQWASNTLQLIWLSTALQQQHPLLTTTSALSSGHRLQDGNDHMSSLRALHTTLGLIAGGGTTTPAANDDAPPNNAVHTTTAPCYMDVVRYLPFSGAVGGGGLCLKGLGKLCQGLLYEMDDVPSKEGGLTTHHHHQPTTSTTPTSSMANTILPILLGSQRTVQQVSGDGMGDGRIHYYDVVCQLLHKCASVALTPATVVDTASTTTTNSTIIVTSAVLAAAYDLCDAVNTHTTTTTRTSGPTSCGLLDVFQAVLNTATNNTAINSKKDEAAVQRPPQIILLTYSAACAVRGGVEGRRDLFTGGGNASDGSNPMVLQVAAPRLPPPQDAATPSSLALLPLAERHQVASILRSTTTTTTTSPTLLTPSHISSSSSVLLPYLLHRGVQQTSGGGGGGGERDVRRGGGVTTSLPIRTTPSPSAAAIGAAAILRGSALSSSSSSGGASSAAAALLHRGSVVVGKKSGGGGLAALSGSRRQ